MAASGAGSAAARDEDVVEIEGDDADQGTALLVDADLAQEEARLQEERRKEQARKDAEEAGNAAPLDDGKYKQLDQLLNQTNLYSKFLSEQMGSIEEETEQDVAVGSKRASKNGGANGAGKRRKGAADGADDGRSPTKDLLPLINGEMRSYQLKGVRWMISLYQNGLNGILADQMGLGKTVQTIGFLSHLRSKGVLGPYMIIGPLSTLPNWHAEFQRWCPSFPVLLYHGSREERNQLRLKKLGGYSAGGTCKETFPAIITSYEIVLADRRFLQKYHFKYIVVDEGHRLKNFDCKLLRELKYIPTNNKLLLSGTPLQNNLPELWSLLHFLLPDVFSSLSQFQSWFDFSDHVGVGADETKVVEAERRNQVVTKLHSILRPFLLRRMKSDVETSLPKKREIILYAHMVEHQKVFNTALVDKTINEVLQKVADTGRGGNAGSLNNALMQLRKNCNHPDLLTGGLDGSVTYPSGDELVSQCGKMRLLERLIYRLKAKGHKILIFSQMTRMLDLLESYFADRNWKACRIDGTVNMESRRRQINDFNHDPDTFLFLLSTRAGGLGINLTAADTCIIYDSDWNPHQDMQAMDRCHRIGQTRPVHVYRLATAHSVEGSMLKKATSKLMLEKLVVTAGGFNKHAGERANEDKRAGLNPQELVELLRASGGDGNGGSLAESGDITDALLDRLMDRSDLEGKEPKGGRLPPIGVGYEMVEERKGGLLNNIE